jgi:hypothetical protein
LNRVVEWPGWPPRKESSIQVRRPQHFRGDQSRFAFGDGAGLVQGNGAQLAGLFQIDAALDQDAAPSGCGESADTVTGVAMTNAQGQAITSRTSAL